MSNARHLRGSAWLNFNRVLCQKWHHRNVVLIGDAAHTAHFSIGSGTKLAMEDAIALVAHADRSRPTSTRALELYQEERSVEALRLQSAARNRMEWFENVARYVHLDPVQFSYTLLTGSQRIGHENLRLRDSRYVERVESWVAREQRPAGASRCRRCSRRSGCAGCTLKNRVVVSPMAMYSCADGVPDDFYLVHLGSRALGGAGLVFTEMTCVAPDARITPGCAGLWNDEQALAWKRIVDFVHARSSAKIGLQLGHAGPKGSTQLGWEEIDEPLPRGQLAVDRAVCHRLWAAQPGAARDDARGHGRACATSSCARRGRGAHCGFDILELHCAHGYLLSSFICPLTNQRTDEYGGSLDNRLRYPLEVFRAMRAVWPRRQADVGAHLGARLGARRQHARRRGGDRAPVQSRRRRSDRRVVGPDYASGADRCTGACTRRHSRTASATRSVSPPSRWATSSRPTIVNSIVAAGRADLCALARPHLADPCWTLHAAAELGYTEVEWPNQYLTGKAQLERNLARAAQMAINV